jgi:hypothetical protein
LDEEMIHKHRQTPQGEEPEENFERLLDYSPYQ